MKASALLTLSFGSLAYAGSIQRRAPCSSAVNLGTSGNAFTNRKLHANLFYRSEIEAAVPKIADSTLANQARHVANVGSFLWLDTIARVPLLSEALAQVTCDEIFGVVVYDLPGRDCAAKASNGELPVGSLSRYKTEYIDKIRQIILANPNVAIAAVIEPDSLPNLVTNANLTTCQNSASGYRDGVAYALRQLNLPNVVMYIDAGHGGWLGWNDNLAPGAKELANAYKAAGNPGQVRGIATNVAGWNAWEQSPGEFSSKSDAQYNKAQDEKRYIDLIGPELQKAGMPNHAIVDTGRNAVTGLREEWGHWCNVNGAGFGVRPTASTGHSLVDAFVWVKPGGESDGTSDTNAVRYDSFCGHNDAYKPAPEAGQWNQAYFEMLVKNAKPQFPSTPPVGTTPPVQTSTPPPFTPTVPPVTPTTPPTNCVSKYGQCGGQGYTGATCCQPGSTCTVSNQFFSQCL